MNPCDDPRVWADTLRTTVHAVFEAAAFALVDGPDPAAPWCAGDDLLTAHVRFEGPFTGIVSLSMPAALARELAANMLGLEPEDTEAGARGRDCVGELLNMVCGNLLPRLAGAVPAFDIGAPHAVDPDLCRARVDAHPAAMRATAALIVEGHAVSAALLLNVLPGGAL